MASKRNRRKRSRVNLPSGASGIAASGTAEEVPDEGEPNSAPAPRPVGETDYGYPAEPETAGEEAQAQAHRGHPHPHPPGPAGETDNGYPPDCLCTVVNVSRENGTWDVVWMYKSECPGTLEAHPCFCPTFRQIVESGQGFGGVQGYGTIFIDDGMLRWEMRPSRSRHRFPPPPGSSRGSSSRPS